ncbi:MAG: response regulator [Bryobacteraceae bacterium]
MKKILVVDDNPVSRELLCELLGAPGREIAEAADGQEALQRIAADPPDLVLLDINMPVLDGYEVVARLRAEPRYAGLRVVALTAFAMRGDRQRALQSGFDGYITKPVDGATLRRQIRELLDNRTE